MRKRALFFSYSKRCWHSIMTSSNWEDTNVNDEARWKVEYSDNSCRHLLKLHHCTIYVLSQASTLRSRHVQLLRYVYGHVTVLVFIFPYSRRMKARNVCLQCVSSSRVAFIEAEKAIHEASIWSKLEPRSASKHAFLKLLLSVNFLSNIYYQPFQNLLHAVEHSLERTTGGTEAVLWELPNNNPVIEESEYLESDLQSSNSWVYLSMGRHLWWL